MLYTSAIPHASTPLDRISNTVMGLLIGSVNEQLTEKTPLKIRMMCKLLKIISTFPTVENFRFVD